MIFVVSTVHRASKLRFDAEEDFKTRARAAVTKLQGGDKEMLAAWKLLCEISRRVRPCLHSVPHGPYLPASPATGISESLNHHNVLSLQLFNLRHHAVATMCYRCRLTLSKHCGHRNLTKSISGWKSTSTSAARASTTPC